MGKARAHPMILPGVLEHIESYIKNPMTDLDKYARAKLMAKIINAEQFKNLLKLGKLLLLDKRPQLLEYTPVPHPKEKLHSFLLKHLDFVSGLLELEEDTVRWSKLARWANEINTDPATLIWFYAPQFFDNGYIPPSGYFDPLEAVKHWKFPSVINKFFRLPVSGLATYELPPIMHSFEYLSIYYFVVGPCIKVNRHDLLYHFERLLDVKISFKRLAKKCHVRSEVIDLAFKVLDRNLYIVKFLSGLGLPGYLGQWIELGGIQLDSDVITLEQEHDNSLKRVIVECVKSQINGKFYCRLNPLNFIEMLESVKSYQRTGRLFRDSLHKLLENKDNYFTWTV